MCPATIWDLPGGLRCCETGEHTTHRFEASGSGITDAPKEDAL